MKKTYVKPQILFSSFELSESISAGCEAISNFNMNDACPVTIPDPGWYGLTYFIEGDTCTYSFPEEDDKLCYHAPSDNNNVYTS